MLLTHADIYEIIFNAAGAYIGASNIFNGEGFSRALAGAVSGYVAEFLGMYLYYGQNEASTDFMAQLLKTNALPLSILNGFLILLNSTFSIAPLYVTLLVGDFIFANMFLQRQKANERVVIADIREGQVEY